MEFWQAEVSEGGLQNIQVIKNTTKSTQIIKLLTITFRADCGRSESHPITAGKGSSKPPDSTEFKK